jgi:hypothetical protein
MRIRGSSVRLVGVSVGVVLALTGFSSRGHGHGGSSGGGGCSSSGQDHDTSSSSTSGGVAEDDSYDDSYDDSDDSGSYGGSSGGYRYRDRDDEHTAGSGSAASLDDATVELLDCVSPGRPYATVRVTNPNAKKGTFSVAVSFEGAQGVGIDVGRAKVDVPADGSATAKVRLTLSGVEDEIEKCDPSPRAPEAR